MSSPSLDTLSKRIIEKECDMGYDVCTIVWILGVPKGTFVKHCVPILVLLGGRGTFKR
jgi:hypothetical protein